MLFISGPPWVSCLCCDVVVTAGLRVSGAFGALVVVTSDAWLRCRQLFLLAASYEPSGGVAQLEVEPFEDGTPALDVFTESILLRSSVLLVASGTKATIQPGTSRPRPSRGQGQL